MLHQIKSLILIFTVLLATGEKYSRLINTLLPNEEVHPRDFVHEERILGQTVQESSVHEGFALLLDRYENEQKKNKSDASKRSDINKFLQPDQTETHESSNSWIEAGRAAMQNNLTWAVQVSSQTNDSAKHQKARSSSDKYGTFVPDLSIEDLESRDNEQHALSESDGEVSDEVNVLLKVQAQIRKEEAEEEAKQILSQFSPEERDQTVEFYLTEAPPKAKISIKEASIQFVEAQRSAIAAAEEVAASLKRTTRKPLELIKFECKNFGAETFDDESEQSTPRKDYSEPSSVMSSDLNQENSEAVSKLPQLKSDCWYDFFPELGHPDMLQNETVENFRQNIMGWNEMFERLGHTGVFHIEEEVQKFQKFYEKTPEERLKEAVRYHLKKHEMLCEKANVSPQCQLQEMLGMLLELGHPDMLKNETVQNFRQNIMGWNEMFESLGHPDVFHIEEEVQMFEKFYEKTPEERLKEAVRYHLKKHEMLCEKANVSPQCQLQETFSMFLEDKDIGGPSNTNASKRNFL